ADNYPGIKGIGEKTALKLLQTYGSMDSILKMKHELTKGIQQKLQDDIDMFELCKTLAEIKCDVPVEFTMDIAKTDFIIEEIHERSEKLRVRSRVLENLREAKFEGQCNSFVQNSIENNTIKMCFLTF